MRIHRQKFQTFKSATLLAILALASLYFVMINYDQIEEFFRKNFCSRSSSLFMRYPVAQNYERKDWHDQRFIEYELTREGPGEQGRAFYLTDPVDIELNGRLFEQEGLSAVVSDKISVNRSVPDLRLPV